MKLPDPPSTPALPAPAALLSVREARARLGIGHTKMYALLSERRVLAVRLDGRTMIPQASLAAFVASLPAYEPTVGTPPAPEPPPPSPRRRR